MAHASSPAPHTSPHHPLASPWRIALLWAGLPLCVLGMVQYRLWEQWHSGRFGELLVLALCSVALAWPLRRLARWQWATALAAPWLLALPVYAGVLPVVATLVLAAAALALGGLLLPRESTVLQATCGVVVLGATLAWLLPVPLHWRWTYLAIAGLLVAMRHRQVLAALRATASGWRHAVDGAPRLSAFAVVAMGLASVGCWLPTLQVDDLGYHLRLPWELLEHGRYAMDAETHIWALAPWLGDVVQAFAQVVAGQEARGAVNALWILLTASGLWRLARELGGGVPARWAAVALYGSLPLTPVLAASMQTETPTTALLVWWLVLIVRPADRQRRWALAGAILVGGLLALKLAAAALALVLLPWAVWRHRGGLRAANVAVGAAVALGVGASSYVYAAWLAGNPFLPLFNARFHSPYFANADFDDARWHAGVDLALPWHLTFDTGRYLEAFAGGGGFVLVALAGAWMLALVQRRTFAAAGMLAVAVAVPLLPMQYLRYVFPACVALLALLSVSAFTTDARSAKWLLAGVCLLNFAFQANGHWMLRTGAVKQALLAAGSDAPSFAHYAPERLLLARLREAAPAGNVLALDPERPWVAEMGRRARTTSRYDYSLNTDAARAEADDSGQAWRALLVREGVGDVLLRQDTVTAPQAAGLRLAGATLQGEAGMAQWWRLPHARTGGGTSVP